ncbi:MAG TPA: isoprenylcysteine carboxylmethyltransferase family protein [Gammaproteobacteria bacterium]|jgi:protein-S-isoprenylcysteine O-methyltransferase Ste14|nr:isoprenylcysteine carboxylmethyltransferase family protein [Gammaproteobacteria bacterium]
MRNYALVLAICWVTFFAVWAVLAMLGGPGGRRAPTPLGRAVRLVLIALIVLAFVFRDRLPVGLARSTAEAAAASGVAAVGCVVCVLGLAFAVWARVTLGRHWGMPMTLHERPELVTSGPYRYVRHPIYTGVGTMTIGTALVFPLAAVWSAAIIAYFVYSARREERDMERLFPDVYPDYRKRSRMLVPFLF